jgi:hypothetical protein
VPRREGANRCNGIGGGGDLDDVLGAKDARRCDLAASLDDGDDMQAGQPGNVHKHEADGTASDDDD